MLKAFDCIRYIAPVRILILPPMRALLPFALLLLVACSQEPTQWEVDVALPIAQGSISLTDYTGDELVTDADGVLHLVLEQNLTDLDLSELVEIPDTTVINSFASPFPGSIALSPGQQFVGIDEVVTMDIEGAEIRELHANSGVLHYTLKNYVGGIIDMSYALPGISLDGESLVLTASLPAQVGETPGEASGAIPLAGYHLDLTGPTGGGFNAMETSLSVLVSESNAGDVDIVLGDSVSIWMHFEAPGVDYARGYFGQHNFDLDQAVGLADATSMTMQGLTLDDIDLQLQLRNYVGIDALLNLDDFSAEVIADNASTPLEAEELDGTIYIARAHDFDGWVDPTEQTFSITSGNSNINAFVSHAPDSIRLEGSLEVNPLADISGGNDFIYTGHTIDAIASLDIPLCIGLEQLTFSDTLAIEQEAGYPAYGILEVALINGSGFTGSIALDLIDESGVVLATFAEDQVFTAGIAAPGNTEAVTSVLSFTVPPGAGELIHAPNRLVARVALATPAGEVIKMYSTDFIELQVKAFATAEITLE